MSEESLYQNAGELTKRCLDDLMKSDYSFFDEKRDAHTKEYLLKYDCQLFSDGLTACIILHGFTGNPTSIKEKTTFVKKKCLEKNIPLNPANIRNWFQEKRPISNSASRKLVFQFCFAMDMTLEEVTTFFLRVYFECPFNFRNHNEVIYYYCFAHGLGFCVSQDLKEKADKFLKNVGSEEPTYEFTTDIGKGLNDIHSEAALLSYIEKNSSEFLINNKTASHHASKLLIENTKLAKKLFEMNEANISILLGDKISHHIERTNNVDLFLYTLLGVDVLQYTKEKSFAKSARLPDIVKSNFPLKMQLSKIRNGEKVSFDTMRKSLILLNFYHYFAVLFSEKQMDSTFCSIESDFLFFVEETNDLLFVCGYPPLYVRNPFDWLVMHCANHPYPLEEFKDAIRRYYLDAIEEFQI